MISNDPAELESTPPAARRPWARTLTPTEAGRVRLHLFLIPVYVWLAISWTTYAIDVGVGGRLDRSGHVKGHDFLHFYVLGQIGLERAPGDLYDFAAQAARADRLVPEYADRFLPIHAPQVAMFFAPLARLPYVPAVTVWLLLSAVLYGVCCRVWWTELPGLHGYGRLAGLAAAGFPAFYALMAAGQTSAFALAWFTAGFVALRQRRPWIAGFVLGSLAYKPTLGLVLPFVFLYARDFRVFAAAALAAAVQFAAASAYFGSGVVFAYLENFRQAAAFGSLLEAQPQLMHSLQSLFSMLVPWSRFASVLYLLSAAATIVLAARAWRTPAPLTLRYAIVLIATVLVSPHLYAYDLVILAPAFLLVAEWLVERSEPRSLVWTLMYLSYLLPAFDSLARLTHVQWSVVALAALFLKLARSATAQSSIAHALSPH